MTKYEIIIPKPVRKKLDNLPENIRKRIISQILVLKENMYPPGCVKLKGYDHEYRIRIGDYRVRYEVRERELIILILHCMHRKDIYRI